MATLAYATTSAMVSHLHVKESTDKLEKRITETYEKFTRFDDVDTETVLDQDPDNIDTFIDAQRIAKRGVDKERCDNLNKLAAQEDETKQLLTVSHAKAIADLRLEHELQVKSVVDDFTSRRDLVHQQADMRLEQLITSTETYLLTTSEMLGSLKRDVTLTSGVVRQQGSDVGDKFPEAREALVESAAKRARVTPDE